MRACVLDSKVHKLNPGSLPADLGRIAHYYLYDTDADDDHDDGTAERARARGEGERAMVMMKKLLLCCSDEVGTCPGFPRSAA